MIGQRNTKRRLSGTALFPGSKRDRSMNRPVSAAARAVMAPRGLVEGRFKGVVVSGSGSAERKSTSYSPGGTTVSTGVPYIASLLDGLAEGVTMTTRVGSKITVKSIDIMLDVSFILGATTSIATAPTFMDVMIVWDKQPNGAVAAIGDIFSTTSTNLSYLLPANTERFVVLKRGHYAGSFTGPNSFQDQFHVNLECDSKFIDATDSPQTNDFYVIALSTGAAAGTTILSSQINYYSRVKFTDA